MNPSIKPLNIPKDSAWDRKTYNPYVLLVKWVYNNYRNTYIGSRMCTVFDGIDSFIRGVKNIIKWAPTIYHDSDWDYYSIYHILQKKIEFTRNLIVNNNRHNDVSSDNFWMTVTINLIERVKNEDYNTEYFDYIDKNYSFDEIEERDSNGGKLYQMNSTVVSDNTLQYIEKNPSKVRILRKTYADFDSMSNEKKSRYISRYKQEQAKRLLFKILQEKIENWWD
jgi:hypothetical protein